MPLGSGYAMTSFDPTQLIASVGDIKPQAGLGEYIRHKGKTYCYVRFDNGVGNVAAVNGNLAYWKDLVNFVVTSDQSDGVAQAATELSFVAGVFLNAITDGYYGWIQTWGLHTSFGVSANGAIGQILVPSATDGQATTVATGAVTAAQAGAQRVATQYAVGAANRASAYITIVP